MSALAKRVVVGFAGGVIVAVLNVFLQTPLSDVIVGVLRDVLALLAPADDWLVAHHVLAVLIAGVVGAVGARTFVAALGPLDAKGFAANCFAAMVVGFLVGAAVSSVVEWLEGSVANGPVALGLITVIAAVAVIGSLRSAASVRRMRESVRFSREVARMDPYLRFSHFEGQSVPMQRAAPGAGALIRAQALQATVRRGSPGSVGDPLDERELRRGGEGD